MLEYELRDDRLYAHERVRADEQVQLESDCCDERPCTREYGIQFRNLDGARGRLPKNMKLIQTHGRTTAPSPPVST